MAKLEPTADVNEIKIRHGKNTRTGETGEFKMDEIHIIPIISKPTTETLVGLINFSLNSVHVCWTQGQLSSCSPSRPGNLLA